MWYLHGKGDGGHKDPEVVLATGFLGPGFRTLYEQGSGWQDCGSPKFELDLPGPAHSPISEFRSFFLSLCLPVLGVSCMDGQSPTSSG